MNKRDVTEVGVKLMAVYTMIRPIINVISIIAGVLLGTFESQRALLPASIGAIVPIVVCMVVISKTDWILNKLYRPSTPSA